MMRRAGFDPLYELGRVAAALVGTSVLLRACEGMKNEHDREPTSDETAGMLWWNSLAESDRAAWLVRADRRFQLMLGPRTSGPGMLSVSYGP